MPAGHVTVTTIGGFRQTGAILAIPGSGNWSQRRVGAFFVASFRGTRSQEDLAASTERTDENHEWLPLRSRNPDQPRQRGIGCGQLYKRVLLGGQVRRSVFLCRLSLGHPEPQSQVVPARIR